MTSLTGRCILCIVITRHKVFRTQFRKLALLDNKYNYKKLEFFDAFYEDYIIFKDCITDILKNISKSPLENTTNKAEANEKIGNNISNTIKGPEDRIQ